MAAPQEDDAIDKLSDGDKRKLIDLQAEFERHGIRSIERFRERDFQAYCRIMAAYFPTKFREALEDALLDEGLTPNDIRRILDKTKQSH